MILLCHQFYMGYLLWGQSYIPRFVCTLVPIFAVIHVHRYIMFHVWNTYEMLELRHALPLVGEENVQTI